MPEEALLESHIHVLPHL